VEVLLPTLNSLKDNQEKELKPSLVTEQVKPGKGNCPCFHYPLLGGRDFTCLYFLYNLFTGDVVIGTKTTSFLLDSLKLGILEASDILAKNMCTESVKTVLNCALGILSLQPWTSLLHFF
jgi:hypothetical protein